MTVRLSVKTADALVKLHDEVALVSNMSDGRVSVPKDTVFKKLRKILPTEFEWIKTRKRLNKESLMMGHCVWSYGDEINKDKCAIYSFIDEEGKYSTEGCRKRYTLEFQFVKKNTRSFRSRENTTRWIQKRCGIMLKVF